MIGRTVGLALFALGLLAGPSPGAWIWVEGEKPVRSSMHRHPAWYDLVKRDQLSGGDFITNFHPEIGQASYRADATEAGKYTLWVRANPTATKLSYRVNDGPWTAADLAGSARETTNIAADGKIDLRFLAWSRPGEVTLKKGVNAIHFRMESDNLNHGALDCFVLANGPFEPKGVLKPGEVARRTTPVEPGWQVFDPTPDLFAPDAGFDLRALNEPEAGRGGFIAAKGSNFVHSASGEPVRFWAVNGPFATDREGVRREARMLAKRGVNLVRIHRPYFDKATGEVDPAAVRTAIETVADLKAEAIYTHFSIYYPAWFAPEPNLPWLRGYDGASLPFAALYFNPEFQAKYWTWWDALLTTPDPATGKRLVDEPAVAGVELINEDSYFFWTFDPKNIPDPQLRLLEGQFGAWLKAKYGSTAKARAAWGGAALPRDAPGEGRMGFRPLWNIANERTARDKDSVRFLAEGQRRFYAETIAHLRKVGFRGVIAASNWATADPRVLGPLEKYTYTVGDFIDRHGYFSCGAKGDSSGWSIRDGHTYVDRSALRFDPEGPGLPKLFNHPAMDIGYDGKPSMISETTWNRPNRFRSEAPLFYAAYGALQGTDAIVHFAQDATTWSAKPGYFMQPWTLMSPAMIGQFPAAALIYRKGLVDPGDVLVDLDLALPALFDLQGTPMPQDASFDELRLADVPKAVAGRVDPAQRVDPLVHLAGRTEVRFTAKGGPSKVADLSRLIDRRARTVRSTTGQVRLDYGRGVLVIDAPKAQAASGSLRARGPIDLADMSVASESEIAHVAAVSLDDRPLATSDKILLQVMTEEKPDGFRSEIIASGENRIARIGGDPWLVRDVKGVVRFKRPDAARLKVTALDANGEPVKAIGTADSIKLVPGTLYYLIAP